MIARRALFAGLLALAGAAAPVAAQTTPPPRPPDATVKALDGLLELGVVRADESDADRLRRLQTRAECDQCLPAQAEVNAALAAESVAQKAYEKARYEHYMLQIAYGELQTRTQPAYDAYRAATEALKNAAPESRAAAQRAVDTAARVRFEAEQEESAAREVLRKALDAWLRAAEIRKQAQQRTEAAHDALLACNRTCPSGDTVTRVIGIAGNNPFDPSDPLGPKGATGQPPQPGAIGSLQLSSASYGGGEGGAVLVVVIRVGGSAGNVTVSYATTPGTASQADFSAASGTLSWRDGDMSSKSFSIALTDDTLVEQTESFTVALSAPTGGATLGSPSTATITIADNDSTAPPQPAGAIQFSASSFTVMENAGSVTITATRTGGSAGEVTVQYFTGPNSAVAGSDYQAVSGVLTWGVGDTGAKSFSVPIINDTLVEGPETFFVTLNNPTGGATLGAPATATVTINDDDVNTGPCGATGNAWTPNAGQYACSGSCSPNPSPRLSINGDLITATQFASGGTATFQGCGQSLNSRESNLTYFGQANHRATITRSSDTNFNANIVSSGGGTCAFSCTRTGP